MKTSILLPFAVFFLLSCEAPQPTSQNPKPVVAGNPQTNFSNPHPATYSVMWHQNSGEYKALCRQAFYLAKKRLLEIHEQKGGFDFNSPAVIVDVDETILDNSPYFAKLALENKVFTSESWKEWTSMHTAEFVPGALDFLHYAKNLDFPVYFVSNRNVDEVESTIRNLNNLGYAVNDPSLFLFSDGNRDKTQRRSKVSEEHEIVLLIGDNLLDFSEAFGEHIDTRHGDEAEKQRELMKLFGEKFIILPNSMYGEWLYDESGNLAGDELTPAGIKFRKSKIRSY